jgi:hypothetical protein
MAKSKGMSAKKDQAMDKKAGIKLGSAKDKALDKKRGVKGVKAVQSKIAKKEGISKDKAGAILAASSRNASAKAKKANPNLKKVKG